MTRLGEAVVRRRPWKGAALALGLAALALVLLVALNLEQAGPGLVLTALVAGAVLMMFVAAVSWHMAVRLARAQFGELLRESRQQSHLLSQLIPDWQWQTDAAHHLVRWQAPQGAPSSSWVGGPLHGAVTQTLWERFEAADADLDLATALAAGQSFQGWRVRDAQGRCWELRGQAVMDATGHFNGYLGTARLEAPDSTTDDAGAGDAAGSGRVAAKGGMAASVVPVGTGVASLAGGAPLPLLTTDWLHALPGPAWLLSDGTHGGSTRLIDFNDAAAQMMGGAVEVKGQLWRACEEHLPDELRQALAEPDLQSGSACGAWWLCLTPVPQGQGQLLSLWPQGAVDTVPAALALRAAEQARADQASFSYTVSHDLRAPLRVVEGFTRILKEDYGRLLDRAGNDHLDRVLSAAGRMHSMIDALLALSQLSSQTLRQETVDLSLLASMVLEELRRSAPERQVETFVQPGQRVIGDPTLLRMVLENLLGNAWKYSSRQAAASIRFESMTRDGEQVFVISDNGAGFDMRFADRLFGVFQRLHSASEFQGTGVGLASARRIVRRHGGDIWAESEIGQGARFYFSLPMA
ncbi:sensor histidine kinase [Roseateles terrae]|uniref:histidine kinase n=1 Tax=Roseateles terrae TaxID=431060 RepID=A0ABR6GWS6_9BURK|nr:ATP-binding protein [Roseateles terrae]MBB3196560.1 signal transduction histidine kinase [Roseateles terrae]